MELIFVFFVVVITWLIIIYNLFVRDKNRVLAAWSDIDVQLKRRHDLIPKLIDAVKQYAAYESSTLSAITALRSESSEAVGIERKGQIESELSTKLHQLIALAEDYPDLKANRSFLDLQKNLTDVENHIQYARRYYNGTVRNLNIRVDSFPDMFIARIFRFIPAEFFDFEEAV
ncbi:MAG: LemA family protein [Gammaproteobacteria bacterium]|nr:LemA family protein [Pseudomonadota bacterium]MCH8976000.1 LemA family protein [Pseudomonadota bacterium]MCH9049250.1 LemA family protein [Pseudomonadota bacterium]